jgi:hypothetical protein
MIRAFPEFLMAATTGRVRLLCHINTSQSPLIQKRRTIQRGTFAASGVRSPFPKTCITEKKFLLIIVLLFLSRPDSGLGSSGARIASGNHNQVIEPSKFNREIVADELQSILYDGRLRPVSYRPI